MFSSIYKPNLYEFKVNIEKYTQRNIPKNSGVHKYALIIIKHLSIIFPNYSYATLNRTKSEVGVGTYVSNYNVATRLQLKQVYVNNNKELIHSMQNSPSGTVINILPGTYYLSGRNIRFDSKGRVFEPIILRADKVGDVTIIMDLTEGIKISSSHISIENIIFIGEKSQGADKIQHAIHLEGDADYINISHNEFINFNSHIKANGFVNSGGIKKFPDNVTIQNNNFYNEWKRNTSSPASPIDVVGGINWTISNNFIADFGKYGQSGKGVTYGLFLKGASENGMIQNNLINCEWHLPHTSLNDTRIGISLGNGGTGQRFCMDEKCLYEHKSGSIIGNTILNCKNDVSIYINKGQDTKISNNYIVNSLGIEVRYPVSSATIYDNVLDGRIKASHKANINQYDNESLTGFD